MTDLLVVDSTTGRPSAPVSSIADGDTSEAETWQAAGRSVVYVEPVADGEISPDVEGLPLALVRLYADIALRHALTHELEPGLWFSAVVGLEGAWGDGASPAEAEQELHEAIIGWVAVKRRVGAQDIPAFEGIDLNQRP
jgi:predicted RNase H-like HicB family nuclease